MTGHKPQRACELHHLRFPSGKQQPRGHQPEQVSGTDIPRRAIPGSSH